MATLSFNKDNRIDDFTFVLVRKDNYNIGAIQAKDVNYNHNFNGPDELSLKVYKDLDSRFNANWDRINDYNDLYVPQLGTNGYFEIEVSLNEDSEGIYKTITATSRCESELSHVKIYNYEVNSEDEITYDENWNKDNITLLYRDTSQKEAEITSIQEQISGTTSSSEITRLQKLLKTAQDQLANIKHRSIMHRLLDKLPNYSIGHVDQTLVELTDWYQFSWDDESVYDIMTGDLANNYHVLFKFDSENRIISLYDLFSVCQNNNCSYRTKMQTDRGITTRFRDDFHHSCPQCGSTNITEGYGKFTKIIVSKDNLMNSGQVSSNKDNLINCFKVKGGDDLMNAAVINQNPNGSDYFYQFSDENLAEMPPNLITKIRNYDTEYNKWYQGDSASGKGIYAFTSTEVNNINSKITFCKNNNFNHDITDNFINLKTTITGYQSLASAYYSLLDMYSFYNTAMVPDLDSSPESFNETFAKLTATNLSPVAVINPKTVENASVQSAIIQAAKCIINTGLYDVTASGSYTKASSNTGTGTWRGTLTLIQIDKINTDEENDYTRTTSSLTITINGNMNEYVANRIEAMVNRKDTTLVSLSVILTQELDYIKQYDQQPPESLYTAFVNKLKEYSLGVLTDVVRPCYVDVLAIIEQNSEKIKKIYRGFYQRHLDAIDIEIGNKSTAVKQIQSVIAKVEKYRDNTQKALNFQTYLGSTLYKVFCDYRREDTFNNDNYIAEDLDNCVVMRRAGELIDAAQKELFKTSHLQYNVTGDLNDLLQLPEFAPIKMDFEVGNWIKMSVDDKIYDLRLLSYSIDFSNLQSINVEFSTVEKIWSGASDIKSVLQAAGSMAGSYSITQGKVKENGKSTKVVRDWVDNGLSATMTKFANDPISQEIVYDSTGLYARGYDDTTGEYLPQQLKIVKNGLYTTDDYWNSVDAGIGAISYTDPENGNQVDTYGIIAKTVVGQLILGENLKIFNSNAGLKMDENGLTITGKHGTGVVKINPNDSSHIFQILNGSTRKLWADNNGDISMTGTITANRGKIGGANGWSITTNQIRSDVEVGSTTYSAVMNSMGTSTAPSTTGAFYIAKNTNGTVTNPFIVYYDGSVKIGGDNGITYNASNGKVTMGSNTSISWNNVTDKSNVANKSDIPTTAQITQITKDTVTTSYVNALKITAGSVAAENITGTTISGKTLTSANITADSGNIGGFYITRSTNTGTSANGGHAYPTSLYRHSADADYEYEVGMKGSGSTSSTTTSTDLAFYVKRINKGATWASTTTMFNVTHAGSIYAIKGTIGGWNLESTALAKLTADGNYRIRLQSPASPTTSNYAIRLDKKENDDWTNLFYLAYSGALYASNATIQGKVTATSGKIGPWTLTSTSLYTGSSTIGGSGVYFGNDGISITDKFVVSDAGTVNAETVYIKKGSFYLTNANGDTNTFQHIQMSDEFIYTGDNSTDRTTIMPDGIYWQGGKYRGIDTVNGSPISWWKASTYKAIGYSYLTTIQQSGATTYARPIIRVRGYDNVFRTPVGSSSTATNYCFGLGARSGNALYVSGAWGTSGGDDTCHITMSSSDIRLKENIQDCTIEALPVIKSIQMKSFDWKDNREFKHQPIGMIADEVEKLDPRLASGGGFEENGSMNIKTIETFYLMGYLVKGMQEQQQEIESLKQIIKELNGGKNYED